MVCVFTQIDVSFKWELPESTSEVNDTGGGPFECSQVRWGSILERIVSPSFWVGAIWVKCGGLVACMSLLRIPSTYWVAKCHSCVCDDMCGDFCDVSRRLVSRGGAQVQDSNVRCCARQFLPNQNFHIGGDRGHAAARTTIRELVTQFLSSRRSHRGISCPADEGSRTVCSHGWDSNRTRRDLQRSRQP